jgi:hypothetical protein
VFEDDAIFREDTLPLLEECIGELRDRPWKVFHLGGHCWGRQFPPAPGCRHLQSPCPELTSTHAVAYSSLVFHRLLDDLPADADSMKAWLTVHRGIDQYLRSLDERYLATPVLVSQASILGQESPGFLAKASGRTCRDPED